MDITFCDCQAVDYPKWRSLWLDYTGPAAAQLTEELHQHTYARVLFGGVRTGFVAYQMRL